MDHLLIENVLFIVIAISPPEIIWSLLFSLFIYAEVCLYLALCS